MSRTTGRYERMRTSGEEVAAFVPFPLPPADPPLVIDGTLAEKLDEARRALERLSLAAEMVPSIDWFIYAFVRKEAVLSSQIEGTQATLVDLLSFETTEKADPALEADLEEVCNYLDALHYARTEMAREGGLPLSTRLLNETHRRLMQGTRGQEKQPGEVRRNQNWIGGTRPGNARFVPPPPQALADCLTALEKYLHSEDDLPPLVRIGLLHVQFETIHPYLDGNGRIGRLLITLLLEHWKLLPQPLLFLSLFFRQHQQEYYERLGAVRTDGDWEGWTAFFLEGVESVAHEAAATARDLFKLVEEDRRKVLAAGSIMAARLFERLPEQPVVTAAAAREELETTKPTATAAVAALEEVGVLVEISGRKRDRVYGYARYLERLRADAL